MVHEPAFAPLSSVFRKYNVTRNGVDCRIVDAIDCCRMMAVFRSIWFYRKPMLFQGAHIMA